METLTYKGELVILTCWCGIKHAVPRSLREEQVRQHESGDDPIGIYCPLGHTHVPAGESKAVALQRKLDRESERRARAIAERDQAEAETEAARRSAAARKGALTRARNRAKNGVCPCCHRTVKQLAEHMKSKHPHFDPAAVA